MTVIYKTKEKEEQQHKAKSAKAQANEITQIVEEMSDQKKKLDDAKLVSQAYDKNRKKLIEKIPDNADKSEPVIFEGIEHKVVFSACQKTRVVTDMEKVKQFMGKDLFFQVAKVTLEDIDKYLTDEQKKQVIEEGVGSTRTCSVKEL